MLTTEDIRRVGEEEEEEERMDGEEDDLSLAPSSGGATSTSKLQTTASSPSSPLKRKKTKGNSTGFRKAPQAPRRFRSPYILFSISKMEEYKKSMAKHGVQVTSFSSQIAQDWKTLPENERETWEEAARQDKLRYNAEKELYTGPWQVPTGRSRKDPNAPKRPPSAFLFYSQTMRTQLKQENPDLKNTEISKLLGQAWKKARPEVRKPHIERELREREVYKKKVAKWREERKEQESIEKLQRQAVTEQYMKDEGFSSSLAATSPSMSKTRTKALDTTSSPPRLNKAFTTSLSSTSRRPESLTSFRPIQGIASSSFTSNDEWRTTTNSWSKSAAAAAGGSLVPNNNSDGLPTSSLNACPQVTVSSALDVMDDAYSDFAPSDVFQESSLLVAASDGRADLFASFSYDHPHGDSIIVDMDPPAPLTTTTADNHQFFPSSFFHHGDAGTTSTKYDSPLALFE